MRPKSNQEQLREISKTPVPPVIFPELARALTDLCFSYDEKEPADLIFIFGTNVIQKEVSSIIRGLLLENISKTLLITGGVADYRHTNYENIPESEKIMLYLDKSEFSDISFLIEKISKNTLENVLEAKKIFDFSAINTVMFLSHSYASMRSRLTLKKIFPHGKILSFPYDIPSEQENMPIGRDTWTKSRYGPSVIWGEFLRFTTYGERGDFPIEEVKEKIEKVKLLAGIV